MKLLLLSLLGCIHVCHSYPAGPPAASCASMTPNHGANAQTSAAPYTITTNVNSYKMGDTITVNITATAAATPFRGFFLQARASGSTNALGRFNIANDAEAQLINCPGGTMNAVAHNSRSDKTTKTFTWTPTVGSNIMFYGTFVNVQTNFWVNVMSPAVTYTGAASTIVYDLKMIAILAVSIRFLI